MVFGILKNEFDDNYVYWENACRSNGHDYRIIDLTKNDWVENINSMNYDGFLSCPSSHQSLFKSLYDERIFILYISLNKFVYPNYFEISLHENKKFLSYWLRANNVPHPKTDVFYYKDEANAFATNTELPIVAKMNIGASGKGVNIFRNKEDVGNYIDKAFTSGIRQNWGPNLKMGGLSYRLKKLIKEPSRIRKRLTAYRNTYNEIQKGFVIFQEYVPHEYEWRVVKIGASFFGHQKVKQGDKASGTKGIDYVVPPAKLLDFVENLCDKHNFNSMSIDLFEDGNGGYLVNEMQTIFGHVQDYICEKDGKPGRFLKINKEWIFEPGNFNTNLSYDLRFNDALTLLKSKK